ncbi:MAG: polysaccharide export protein [Candidatus Tectomicrobia bacterium]|uniref:Polysaccharide export protein n=1 Tax=Tectimicrobiota bacterium TaxID=2528274 RepID=A0A938B5K4_UNCTE|nr:polysaccharide export protein [Candidatus Tectomicrobia bacterium]
MQTQAIMNVVLLVTCLLWLNGCMPSATPPDARESHGARASGHTAVTFDTPPPSPVAVARLAQLWQGRMQGGGGLDHPLGPGDILDISVPAIPDLKDRTVRISGEGTINLPLLGGIRAAGLTDGELYDALQRRLATYMHRPQVSLFVREYRSRQVAVMGAVAKPGLYTLASGADTVLDILGAAGGMTDEAASYILFIPIERPEGASPGEKPVPLRLASLGAPPPRCPDRLSRSSLTSKRFSAASSNST